MFYNEFVRSNKASTMKERMIVKAQFDSNYNLIINNDTIAFSYENCNYCINCLKTTKEDFDYVMNEYAIIYELNKDNIGLTIDIKDYDKCDECKTSLI
jgi:ferredoxin-like protein FixX